MIRFNSRGKFNVPFCRKRERFSKSYITKIINQIKNIQEIIIANEYQFICQSFEQTLNETCFEDFIYCDPPYIGRHVDYYNGWNEADELRLHQLLNESQNQFILSTWHSSDYRHNHQLQKLWQSFHILTREHFYHVGGFEKNRNSILEALITNLTIPQLKQPISYEQLTFL